MQKKHENQGELHGLRRVSLTQISDCIRAHMEKNIKIKGGGSEPEALYCYPTLLKALDCSRVLNVIFEDDLNRKQPGNDTTSSFA